MVLPTPPQCSGFTRVIFSVLFKLRGLCVVSIIERFVMSWYGIDTAEGKEVARGIMVCTRSPLVVLLLVRA